MKNKNNSTQTVGQFGEDAACNYLILHGWKIVERNYRYSHLEIDIIAEKDDILAFIEVKTRKFFPNSNYGTPGQAVTYRKKLNIINAAQGYLIDNPTDHQSRLDVIEIYTKEFGNNLEVLKLNYYENAYTLDKAFE